MIFFFSHGSTVLDVTAGGSMKVSLSLLLQSTSFFLSDLFFTCYGVKPYCMSYWTISVALTCDTIILCVLQVAKDGKSWFHNGIHHHLFYHQDGALFGARLHERSTKFMADYWFDVNLLLNIANFLAKKTMEKKCLPIEAWFKLVSSESAILDLYRLFWLIISQVLVSFWPYDINIGIRWYFKPLPKRVVGFRQIGLDLKDV